MTMLRLLIVVCSIGGWCCHPAMAQDLRDRVREIKLDNGMTWFLVERHQSPVFSGLILVKAGGVDENRGESGMAHLSEHMAFKGTRVIGTTNFKKEKKILEKIDSVAIALDQEKIKQTHRDAKLIALLQERLKALQTEGQPYVKKDEFSQIYETEGAAGLNAWTNKDFTNYHVSLPANKLELWMWLESDRIKNPVFR
jgi:predicted Zn-dependent peptidase